jgi:RNA polymerase sigma-70 factor (ECF subfamily)
MNTTSITLLERLRAPGDEEAWSRFVRLYTPLLYYWCRRVGLRQQDAADLVQDVLAHLVRKLPEFEYNANGSFRSWLRVVTVNKWRERQRKRSGPSAINGTGLDQVPASTDVWVLEEAEYRQHLVRSALPLIQPEFSETAWRAFEEHVLEQRDAAEVAEELGIRIGTVYAAKSRVLTRLRHELARFLEQDV